MKHSLSPDFAIDWSVQTWIYGSYIQGAGFCIHVHKSFFFKLWQVGLGYKLLYLMWIVMNHCFVALKIIWIFDWYVIIWSIQCYSCLYIFISNSVPGSYYEYALLLMWHAWVNIICYASSDRLSRSVCWRSEVIFPDVSYQRRRNIHGTGYFLTWCSALCTQN